MAELGWETFNAFGEFDPSTGSGQCHGASTLERETQDDVILKSRLRLALIKINPEVSIEAIHQAIEELTRDRSRMSMAAANREIYNLLKNGVRVPVSDPEGDGETVEVVRVIDWDDPDNNDFLLCSQFWVTGEMHIRRADLVGCVNGLVRVRMRPTRSVLIFFMSHPPLGTRDWKRYVFFNLLACPALFFQGDAPGFIS
jgi:type I restriction enzyme R subunit